MFELSREFSVFPVFEVPLLVVSGARGRSRTDTLLRAVDFLISSAFAALSAVAQVRDLEHAFTIACGFRCPPSALYTFPLSEGLARRELELSFRAFTDFDGLHLKNFLMRAQVLV
jgi:hypothetical protein